MSTFGDEGGSSKDAKTNQPSTGKKTLEQLAYKNPFYADVLNMRAIGKVRSTYCEGMEKLLDSNSRVHGSNIHRPSTMRLSMRSPNLTNVVADKEDNKIAAGFRQCVVAQEECNLLESDFTGIEALLMGWLIKDPRFIRLSRLGIHDWHASHVLGRPINLNQSDEALGKAFKELKKTEPVQRNKSKITIYSSLYKQSPWGLQKTWPETFATVADAAKNQDILYSLFPLLTAWHGDTQLLAHRQGYLGLEAHPWKYRHWFWDVFTWDNRKQEWKGGSDSKRALAYFPQSIAAGIIKEASIRIAKRIGHCFLGKTPIRALIHDSILCEIEDKYLDYAKTVIKEEMTRPIKELPCPIEWGIGPYLSVGIAMKQGKNWAEMEDVDLEIGTASDFKVFEEEDNE